MAYETKALLIGMAEYALLAESKVMYDYVAKMANAEGVVLKSYAEAKAEKESK